MEAADAHPVVLQVRRLARQAGYSRWARWLSVAWGCIAGGGMLGMPGGCKVKVRYASHMLQVFCATQKLQ